MRVPLPEARVVRWFALAPLVVLAACSEEQPTDLPIETTPLATHLSDCPPSGSSVIRVYIEDANEDPLPRATVVLVHPRCGPVAQIQDGAGTDLVEDGLVTFTGLAKNELYFAHARDGVNAEAAALDIFPPANPNPDLVLGASPEHAARLTGPRGTSLPVTSATYLAAIAAPPIKTNGSPNGVTVTLVLPTSTPLTASFVGLGGLEMTTAVGAITKFGDSGFCKDIPWLKFDDDCLSGAGVGYPTGIDVASEIAKLIFDPGCILEALAEGASSIEAASAECAANQQGGDHVDLIATPLVCDVTDIGTVDDDIGDGGNVDVQGPVQFAVMGKNYPDVLPDPARITYWGTMVVSADASMRFKSKTSLAGGGSMNSSTTFSVTTDGECSDFVATPGSTTVVVHCAPIGEVVPQTPTTVAFAVVESDVPIERDSHAFRLEEVGKEYVPDADQAGGTSFATVPALPLDVPEDEVCTWEEGNSRLSVRL